MAKQRQIQVEHTDDFFIGVYTVYASCEGIFSMNYTPGTAYCRNGDPGDPPDGDIECIDFDWWIDSVLDEDGDEVPTDIISDIDRKTIEDSLYETLEEKAMEA